MIESKVVRQVCKKLSNEKPINILLPDDGILHIEKIIPYICVYRFKGPDPYFSGLLKTQASYLIVKDTLDVSNLLASISETISKKLNAFLILEAWPLREGHQAEFKIFCPDSKAPATINTLNEGLNQLQEIYPEVSTMISATENRHPKHLEALLGANEAKIAGALLIGLEIPTIYERSEEQQVYSLFYRKFYSKFSEVIKRTAYEFIRVQTSNPFGHYLMLGKTQIDNLTKEADKELAKISEGMSFLLRTTPVNSTSEWKKFQKNNFEKPPSFNYRLLALDPEIKKRKLYDLHIDQVEDPTLAFILRDKRLEIEKQLTMLEERGTDNFRYVGESLYGKIDDDVVKAAKTILRKHPKGNSPQELKRFSCHEFAEKAQKEIDYYQELFPKLKLSLEIRKDVAGIMVSKSKLLISDQLSLDENRCDALIQHEIGTHILTYCNGRSQPLHQMYAGFAGYDQLQEGLAVLAEYLVGGLTVNRMRLLAGRVIATESMIRGADFIETFNLLRLDHNFPERVAYYITMRIYRGGGLTKDAVYLAGLINVMDFIKNQGNLENLYTGKFNINHVDLIEELLHRGVLVRPKLPRFMEREQVQFRLQKLSEGLKVTELLD